MCLGDPVNLAASLPPQVDMEVMRRMHAAVSRFLDRSTLLLSGTLRDAFIERFAKDSSGMLRSWKPGDDITVSSMAFR